MKKSTGNQVIPVKRKAIWHIITSLVVLSFIILTLRVTLTQLYTSTDAVWSFTINLQFDAEKADTVLKLSPPSSTSNSKVIRQSLHHPDSTVRYTKNKYDGKIIISILPDNTGKIEVDAEFLVHISRHPRVKFKTLPLSTEARERYLDDNAELDIQHQKISEFLNELLKISDDKKELVEAIYKYVRTYTVADMVHPATVRPAPEIMGLKKINRIEQINLFIALSRAARIPARAVTGFIFRERPDIHPQYWAEVYINDEWYPVDPYYGYRDVLPNNYVPFRYDAYEIISLSDSKNLEVNYDLIETRYRFLAEQAETTNTLLMFDLTRLPQEIRNTLAALFLLPLGVLITVIFRHYIGIQNYGVFTPSLLSLALTRNDLFTTTITLGIIIFFVIVGRFFFPKKMNRTPRLAIIFTLVILSTGFALSFIDIYYPSPEGFAVLLPVIILSSLVDNFYKIHDTRGKYVALVRLFWTVIITMFCIPVLKWEALGHQLVAFPELHLVTMAAILLFTIYKGKTFTQLIPPPLLEGSANKPGTSKDTQ